MSKVSETKAAQGWRKHPNTCADCIHFTSQKVEETYGTWTWTKETFLRCSLGDFKTGKSNTCDRFEAKPADK
ncbi:hypothetical protein [Burkholderia cepacia]|uniref:hypothetical protein n=1 Tax=Burkholderia cepacia TaxID=292 RepID=UPI001CF3BA2B|nr:hypothetical protein [Burkholderia cepacia]MCA8026452.1 hypothetical protein [Burkholderia cepacia]